QSVAYTARSLRVSTIVAATESGHTAKMISKYRPSAKIIALTFSESQARKLVLAWGVEPFVVEKPASTDEMMSLAGTVAKESGYAQEGNKISIRFRYRRKICCWSCSSCRQRSRCSS